MRVWSKVGGWKALVAMFVAAGAFGIACTLNPQPLPPGAAAETGADAGASADARGNFGNDADGAGGNADAAVPSEDAGSDSAPVAPDADAGDAGADAADAESDAPVDAGAGG
jgi:hypothetical protein